MRNAPREEREAFSARLLALADAHNLMTEQNWDRVSVGDVIRRTLTPFPQDQFEIDGPEAHLNANRSLGLTMAVHELATNSVKYGALSDRRGKVRMTWALEDDQVIFRWQEVDGPAVVEPTRRGFGSLLIEQAIEGTAHLTFAPNGVVCTIAMTREPFPGAAHSAQS
jgi:two-component sensor histidine kinase